MTILNLSYSLIFVVGPHLHATKLWVVVVAHKLLVSAQGPLVLGFLGFWVWELRVWGQGLTINISILFKFSDLQ